VALQRKAVKTDDSLGKPNLPPKGLQSGKELLRKGARGIQTLYMTERMPINRKTTRDGEPGRRFVPGSY
jgi:hypothetical protein